MSDRMDRLFRFDMYPADWLLDTGDLTPEEQGMFLVIVLMLYSKRGRIPDDPDELSRKFKKCSSRKARSIISSLVQKEKLKLSDGYLYQGRTERELNKKRTHLENSAKGGRTKAENYSEDKENKYINSSEYDDSLPTPSPNPSPYPIAIEDQSETHANHVLKTMDFSILSELDSDGLINARVFASASGQDLNVLARVFDNGVNIGILEKPRNPGPAFIAWIKSISGKIRV